MAIFSETLLACFVFLAVRPSASLEVCTNSLIPGAKGDKGPMGDEGDVGIVGKAGPPGRPGNAGDAGVKGDLGHLGKMGPMGDKGEKGDPGLDGLAGQKGKAGSTCDCGRYRRIIGPLDVTLGKLRDAVKFAKHVLLGLRETEERYYFLVKEAKVYQEALVTCGLRGGILAMPKTPSINRILADYISQAGLTRVYVGVKADPGTNGTRSYLFSDSSSLQAFSGWTEEDALVSLGTNSSCVELLTTGTWAPSECDNALFFICEFPKSRRRGVATPTALS